MITVFYAQVRKTPVETIAWPLCPHCVTKTSNGNLLLHSLDRNACIKLICSGRVFTVTHWVAVSRRDSNETQHKSVTHLLTHHYSINDVPQVWACLLDLLVTAARNNTECCHSNKQTFTVLPGSLPLMCRNVHLHHWDKVIVIKLHMYCIKFEL